jgi:RNA polymerase sigma factor (sigma-70 family)
MVTMDGISSMVEAIVPDRELLARFVEDKDEQAFSELVGRHARMALGACRRILGDSPEADDALQATFLILVARAGELHRGGGGPRSLGGWLHRVATNAALQAHRESKARTRRESVFARSRAAEPKGSPLEELLPILDDEVRRLPDRYRTPLVLCYFQDRSMQGAADELGVSYSTLRRRLDRALELLRGRLSGRGCAIAPALLGAFLWESAALANELGPDPSESLAGTILEPPTASTGPSPRAITLSRGVLRMMRNQMIRRSATLLAVVLLLGSTGFATRDGLADDGPSEKPPADKANPAKPDRGYARKTAPVRKAQEPAPRKAQASAPKKARAAAAKAGESDTPELDREILESLNRSPFGGRGMVMGPQAFQGSFSVNGQDRQFANPQDDEQAARQMQQFRPMQPQMMPMFGFVNPAILGLGNVGNPPAARRPDAPNRQAAPADRPQNDRQARPLAKRAPARKKAASPRAEDAARMLNMRAAPGFGGVGGPGMNRGNGGNASFWWIQKTW